MELALNMAFIFIMGILAIIDIKKHRLELWGLVLLATLLVIKGFNWSDAMFGFSLMFACFLMTEGIFQDDGNDWIILLSIVIILPLMFKKFIISYFIIGIFSIIGIINLIRESLITKENKFKDDGKGFIAGGDILICPFVSAYLGPERFLVAFIVSGVVGMIAKEFYFKPYFIKHDPYIPYLTVGAILGLIL